jgi:hypothetical protein
LHAGDRLDVNDHGTSHNITVLDEAVEVVGKGGTSVLTTINEGGQEQVFGGAANLTTINGGDLVLYDHATADHTKLNAINSDLQLHEGSVAKNTVIQNGGLYADATSTIENVTFEKGTGKFVTEGVGVENPQNLKGTISGLAVGDVLQFGGLQKGSPNIDVTSFEVKNNTLTITYNNGQHASYQLKDMQPGTTFTLEQGTDPWGDAFSRLTVTKAPAPAALAHDNHSPSDFDSPLVGVDAHHHDFGHHLFG